MSARLPWTREHPARRALEQGVHALTDTELVALVATPRGVADLEHARRLLQAHGGLRGLLDGHHLGPRGGAGTSPSVAARLAACRELMQRYLRAPLQRGDSFLQSQATERFLVARLGGQRQEVFACLFLDARNRLLHFREMFHGTIDGASVHPREVVRAALEINAAALIVAHNHPSGEPEPSAADRAITQRLRQAAELVDVRLLDHFVVGGTEAVSFAERGWL
jgi:DNA repair protein RadC